MNETVNYLYKRQKELKAKERQLEKNCFNSSVRPVLAEVRARLEEVNKIIRIMKHDI